MRSALSDVIPGAIHRTVPRTRRHLPALPEVAIHTTARPLHADDVAIRDGIRVTAAARTILDAADAGTAPEQIALAVRQAIARGLTTAPRLMQDAGARRKRVTRLIAAAAFRTALEQRLLTAARQAGVPVVRLRTLVVFDRLLARLLIVAPDQWLLKGALALDLRLAARSRTTKDMDLARRDDEEHATADFLAAQVIDLGDSFTFVIERTAALDVALEGAAVRYHVAAALAGRPFEDALIDVAFGGSPATTPVLPRGSDVLSFAGIDPITVPALPLAQHIAEKVHGCTRTDTGGRASSRVKDLIDLVVIRSAATFEARNARRAPAATFLHRDTHLLPTVLPTPPADWGPAYRRLARAVGLDPDVRTGFVLAAAFLDPLLAQRVSDRAQREPLSGVWEEPD